MVYSALLAGLATSAWAQEKTNVVVLSEENTVVLHSVMTDDTTSKVLAEILEKDASLAAGKPIYLFLDSPGGSVVAGLDMIQGIQGLGREVKTITSFAASMAFITVQSLDERIIMPHGVLMSHRAKGGVDGQIPGEMDSRYWFWKKYLNNALKQTAKRLGMSVEQLQNKHRDEWWTSGSNAVAEHTSDRVALVKCDSSLVGTMQEEVQTLFGPLKVTWSKCPLVKSPLKIDMKGIAVKKMNALERQDFDIAIKELFFDQPGLLRDFVMSGKYARWFK